MPAARSRTRSGPGSTTRGKSPRSCVTGTAIRCCSRAPDGGTGLAGYAVCHHGAGSEGNSALAFVKTAAVRPGPDAAEDLKELLAACEALAARRGAEAIAAGTNTGRREAYRILRERGYLSFMNAVAMLRPASDGYGVPGVYAIDDWR